MAAPRDGLASADCDPSRSQRRSPVVIAAYRSGLNAYRFRIGPPPCEPTSTADSLRAVRPNEGLIESLRLAAKAADRAKAAEKLRPAFERRLKKLGYGPRSIAHAFSSLTGPDTVAETLAQLAQNARMERSKPVPLDFETVEQRPGLPDGHSLTITRVERDDHGSRIMYEIRPPLASLAHRPRVEALDDCGQDYRALGEHLGLAGSEDRTTMLGGLTMPLPQQHASLLHVRMSWSKRAVTVGGPHARIADHAAIAHRILTNADGSPLYNAAEPGALRRQVLAATEALDTAPKAEIELAIAA